MERKYIKDIHAGEEVLLDGWIFESRELSKLKFLVLRDVSGKVQCIAKDEKVKKIFSELTLESVVQIKGVVKTAKIKAEGLRNDVEVEISDMKILSKAEKVPIQVNEKAVTAGLDKRLNYRWLDLRKDNSLFIFKLWTHMEEFMREWWIKNNFIQIYTPKFMGSASESGAELFEVKYFDRKAYLAQSPQFYKQMAMASGFERIFEISPAFRANPSDTSRHDTEFTMIDMEISFIDSEEGVMKIEEQWIAYFLKKIKEEFGKEIEEMFGVEIVIPKLPFPRISMEEAVRILKEKRNYVPSEKGDLDAEGEKLLAELIKEKYNHEFVFVTDYPISVRPFYHMRQEKKPTLTKSFDLIWKGVEITTGAQREHRPDRLKKQAIEKGINPKSIQYYLDFFKYGCPPHGGCALSPTRLLMLMLNLGNVREATFLPRDMKRLTP